MMCPARAVRTGHGQGRPAAVGQMRSRDTPGGAPCASLRGMSQRRRATSSAVLPMLSASEVAEFGGYCPQAWWLRRHGVVGAAIGPVRRDEGVVLHRDLGRHTDRLHGTEAGSRAVRAMAIGLLVLAAVLLLFALVARPPPFAWAAGLEDATVQGRVSATAALLLEGGPPVAEAGAGLLVAGLCALVLSA
jgi:hypothetical protein